MRRYAAAIATAALALLAFACSAEIDEGRGTLPKDMEADLVPNVDYQVYLYFKSDTPVSVDAARFMLSDSGAIIPDVGDGSLPITSVSMVATSLEQFGGFLEFDEPDDAELAFSLLQNQPRETPTLAHVEANRVDLVHGRGEWSGEFARQVEAASMIPLRQSNPRAWNMLTHLPISENDPPLAAGFISADGNLLSHVAAYAGIDMPGLGAAFGMIRVDTLAFGVYGDLPAAIPERIDVDFLQRHKTGVVMVSQTGYAGLAVSFLLRSIASKTGMETIALGRTNARYLELEDGHLILKNKGSLIYAVVAGERQEAEALMLRALAG